MVSGKPNVVSPRVRLPRSAWASGGMADAHGSGPCVRKDVGVQLPPRPLDRGFARTLAREGSAELACEAVRGVLSVGAPCRGSGALSAVCVGVVARGGVQDGGEGLGRSRGVAAWIAEANRFCRHLNYATRITLLSIPSS